MENQFDVGTVSRSSPTGANDLDSPKPSTHEVSGESDARSSMISEKPSLPSTDRSGMFDSPTMAVAAPVSHEFASADLKVVGFEILGLIGQGGMGAVFEARQISLSRRVAIKVLAPELASRSDIVERFDREAATLARLTHPNIVTILERGRSDEHYYFIMEFVEGPVKGIPRDLRQLIGSHELDERSTQRRICQVSDALAFAHSEGITHRDIKPSNIMIDRHGNVKVADFGIASGALVGGGQLTVALSSLGTPDYMAPEQRRDAARVDHRADIYSTGVMLYEMLTGELPMGVFEPPSQVAKVSQDWDAIVARAMNPRPEMRWQSMDELRQAVEQVRLNDVLANSAAPLTATVAARSHDTETDDLLKSANRHFELAQTDGDLLECFQHAEQAGLILARILKTKPNEEFQKRLNAVNRLATRLARRGAKEALSHKRSSAAVRYLEWLVELDPITHDQALKLLQQIQHSRESVLTEVRVLLDGCEIQRARTRLDEVQEPFGGEPEFETLAEECQRHVDALQKFREVRFPQLRDERRFCELARETAFHWERWPDHAHLEKLSEQVAAKVAKADQLVKCAQQLLSDDQVDEALKKVQNAVALVADHPDALRFVAEISAGGSQLHELVAHVGTLVAQGRWFAAKRKLHDAERKGLRSSQLEAFSAAATAGCDGANRYRAFLWLVFIGGGVSLLSGKLALLFRNGLFEQMSWDAFRPAIDAGAQLLFEWALLIGLIAAIGRRVSRSQIWICLPLLAGSGAIVALHKAAAWEALLGAGLYGVLLSILPLTFAAEITSARLLNWRSIRIVVGSSFAVFALLAMTVISSLNHHERTSYHEALVVSGLLAVFGLSSKWWRAIPILGASFLGDVLVVGAARSGLGWYVEYQTCFTCLLIGVAAIVCCGSLSKWTLFGSSVTVLFAFGMANVLRDIEVVPSEGLIWTIWFCACGSVAAQFRGQFDFGWHMRDRFGSATKSSGNLHVESAT